MNPLTLTPPPATASGCSGCQTLPARPPTAGVLYLNPPPGEAREAVRELFADPPSEPLPGVLAVEYPEDGLTPLADALAGGLDERLQRATRTLLLPAGAVPTAADLLNAQPLADLLAGVRSGWLAEVLRADRLVTHFQPIVSAADPTAVHGYECLLRATDAAGGLIPPGRLFAAAADTGLLYHLDRAARVTAIRSSARAGVAGRLFVNFYPTAIYDPSTCLRTTFRAAQEAGLDPARVVFEVVESERVRDTRHLIDLLAEYRRAGFRVALDDVGAGYSSLTLLAHLRPDYVKIDMGLVRGAAADPVQGRVVGKLLDLCRELGIRSIAEGVETATQWGWLRDHGADLVQGYLFGRPAAAPAVPGGW